MFYFRPYKQKLAEEVRFELTDGFPSLVFKTSAIDHSATLPDFLYSKSEYDFVKSFLRLGG